MTMMRAIALAKASCGFLLPLETRLSLYKAVMAMVAMAALSVSSLNLISFAGAAERVKENRII
jgi:hypothetical protein